jgi:hypothetical protein
MADCGGMVTNQTEAKVPCLPSIEILAELMAKTAATNFYGGVRVRRGSTTELWHLCGRGKSVFGGPFSLIHLGG